MAEIATNVLHNVGNVLNSVNVSADVVRGKLRDSKTQGLAKAVQLIGDHAADLGDFLTRDEKGKLLPGYLAKLAGVLEAEQREMIEEMGHLTKSVDHIKEIVATQQSYAGASSVVESVLVHDLVEDALRMNSGSLTRHQVSVVNEVGNLPRMQLDKHRVLLVLINLISNAKNAMDGVNDRPHQIKLQAEVAWPDRLSLRVIDNGCGIDPEILRLGREGHWGLSGMRERANRIGARLKVFSTTSLGTAIELSVPGRIAFQASDACSAMSISSDSSASGRTRLMRRVARSVIAIIQSSRTRRAITRPTAEPRVMITIASAISVVRES